MANNEDKLDSPKPLLYFWGQDCITKITSSGEMKQKHLDSRKDDIEKEINPPSPTAPKI